MRRKHLVEIDIMWFCYSHEYPRLGLSSTYAFDKPRGFRSPLANFRSPKTKNITFIPNEFHEE